MALVVEDGTGRADADSYATLEAALARHTALGNAAWAAIASDALREQALRRATEYMVGTYRLRWSGVRKSTTQALDWPRDAVPLPDSPGSYHGDRDYFPSNQVPQEVVNACIDLALKAATSTLAPDLGRAVRRRKVGPIDTEYEPGASQVTQYRAIDLALAPFLRNASGGAMMRIRRA